MCGINSTKTFHCDRGRLKNVASLEYNGVIIIPPEAGLIRPAVSAAPWGLQKPGLIKNG